MTEQAVQEIIATGQRLDARGLAPATSGNYSVRLKDGRIAVTVSGRHKGRLTSDDVMAVDSEGRPLEDKKPSDETKLHIQIYAAHPNAQAILHIHSVPGAVITRLNRADEIVIEGYEMLKAFPGVKTHETNIAVPVVDNSQDMNILSSALAGKITSGIPAYIIRDHGFYVWGKDMAEAERVAEALEYLLSCEMETMKIRAGVRA